MKAFSTAGLSFPWRHRAGPRKGEIDWKPLAHHVVLRILHNPRYAGAFTFGRHRDIRLPGGKLSRTVLPREEWISFIPGAHPGYITLDQYDANRARLAANAAAHGRDRAAGPPREGPALLQGIIICGTCGQRMTVRYHQRRGRQLPTYVCQRDGIEHARRICQAVPGAGLDDRIGQLLIDTLTPLAIEAALTVSAELEHRADQADALRAAHVERARYHADLARRRYLAVDPANRLVADTLEADWNTALRALTQAQDAYDHARRTTPGSSPTPRKPGSGSWSPTCPRSGTTPPPRPASASASPGCCSPTSPSPAPATPSPRTSACPRPAPHPHHAGPAHRRPAAQDPAEAVTAVDELLDRHTHAQIAGILNDRGLTSGEGRPFHPLIVRNIRDDYGLRSREQRLRDAGMLTLAEIASQLGVLHQNRQDLVPRRAHHRAPLQRQRPVPLPAARPQPASPGTRTQTQRTAPRPPHRSRRQRMNPPRMSDPTATVSTSTTTEHPESTRRGAV